MNPKFKPDDFAILVRVPVQFEIVCIHDVDPREAEEEIFYGLHGKDFFARESSLLSLNELSRLHGLIYDKFVKLAAWKRETVASNINIKEMSMDIVFRI